MRSYPSRPFKPYQSIKSPVVLSSYNKTWQEQYGDNWEALRDQCLRRDNYQCQKCLSSYPPPRHYMLHAHHIIELSRKGPNSLANLTTLCKNCHKEVHGRNK